MQRFSRSSPKKPDSTGLDVSPTRASLEAWYRRYNRPEYIHPDPLEVVLEYSDPADQEIVGLIAASLALGRVASILTGVRDVLRRFPEPRKDLLDLTADQIRGRCAGFVYRFYREGDLSEFLLGIRGCIRSYGSLESCFESGAVGGRDGPGSGAVALARSLRGSRARLKMVADPELGSSCKRLHLFLRWMVRRDAVDPGCWHGVDPATLLVPVDTHMLRIAGALGFTSRKQADRRTVEEITEAFRRIRPDDPARYDFSLTRMGIRPSHVRCAHFIAK